MKCDNCKRKLLEMDLFSRKGRKEKLCGDCYMELLYNEVFYRGMYQ